MDQIKQIQQSYLKEQICKYESKRGLQDILRQIAIKRDQLKLISGKQNNIYCEKLKNQEELQIIYKERAELETQLQDATSKRQYQYNQLKKNCDKQLEDLYEMIQLQTKIISKNQNQNKKMEGDRAIINQRIMNQTIQENQQNLACKNQELQFIISKNLKENHNLNNKNRQVNIKMQDIHDRFAIMNQQKGKLQYDYNKLTSQKQHIHEIKQQLSSQLEEQSVTYDNLIKKSQLMEAKLIKERKDKEKYQNRVSSLEQEIKSIYFKDRGFQQKIEQLDSQFLVQKNLKDQWNQQLETAQIKLQKLKKKRKDKFDRKVLLIGQLKAQKQNYQCFTQQEKLNNIQQTNSTNNKTQQKNEQYSEQILEHNDLATDNLKWKNMKEIYKSNFHKTYGRLHQQNLKLTYRYNDLLKISLEDKTYLKHLLNQVSKLKSKINFKENFGKTKLEYLHKTANQTIWRKSVNKTIKKPMQCISFHETEGKFITET